MNELIKQVLTKSKTIAMVGVSSIKKDEKKSNIIRRRPSIIVMKYLQEFGYKIIPVNPFSTDKEIYGEPVMKSLEEINVPIDIVNVFRPSKETPVITKQAISIGAKTLWLQYGIENEDAKKLVQSKNINYIANKCIKQEYQKLFLKANPVFPVLQ